MSARPGRVAASPAGLHSAVRWERVDSFLGNRSASEAMFHRPCPICGANEPRTVLVLNDFQFFSDSHSEPKRVDIREVQCQRCMALYLNPCYSAYGFPILFAEAGQSYGSTEGRPAEQIDWMTGRGLLKDGAAVLDIGCYDGAFLARLPGTLQRIGVDIDGPAIERGRERHGAEGVAFVEGDFESFEAPVPPDTITMFHVLEHLPRPVEVLRNLRANARSQTRLIVEVPILENGGTNDINGFFSVQHMTHFSRQSLRNSLQRSGWRVEEWSEQSDYNGCRVLAAPVEISDNVSVGSEDALRLWEYLSTWYAAVAAVNRRLAKRLDTKRVVLWGAGMHAEFLYHLTGLFVENGARRFRLVDSDPVKQGTSWRGVPIAGPESLRALDWEVASLVISSYGSQEAIAGAAVSAGVPEARIVRLYDQLRRY